MSSIVAGRLLGSALLVAALAGCGGSSRVECASPDQVLVEQGERRLTCADASRVPDYIHVLAGRGPSAVERSRVITWVRDRYRAEPEATAAWLARIAEDGGSLEVLTGLEGAEVRARKVYEADRGEGLITPDHGEAGAVQKTALAVWASDDDRRLALTETDIEGFIRYASLCREVQGGGPVALSVSDRVQVYRMVQDRFKAGSRREQVALASFGPYWSQVKDAWQAASYERQQAWIAAAPLPPPMNATSLGYAEAVLHGDLPRHAGTLHGRLGPFTMVKGRRAFGD